MVRDVVTRSVFLIGFARLRAHDHSLLRQAIYRLRVSFLRLSQAGLAEIEDRYLELDLGTSTSTVRTAGFALRTGDTRDIKQINEARRFGESVRFGEGLHLNAGNLQVYAPPEGFGLRSNQGRRRLRQRRKGVRKFKSRGVVQKA